MTRVLPDRVCCSSRYFRMLMWVAAALLVSIELTLVPAVLAQTTAGEWNARGQEDAGRGDLDRAIADFTRAIELAPKSAIAYGNRGVAKLDKGDLDGGIADISRALGLDPKFALGYYNRGKAKQSKGDFDGAIADYTRAIDVNPKYAMAFTNRGTAKEGKGELNAAIVDYTRAIEIDPKDARAYYNRGNAKRDSDDLDGAIRDFTRAIDIDSKYAMAYNNLAWLLATANRPAIRDGQRAVESALKACELSQWKDAGFLDTLAAAYARNGDFAKAVEWQQKLMADPRAASDVGVRERLRLYRVGKAWPPD